jgi:uncharacterized protein YecT (DUF1311 family)
MTRIAFAHRSIRTTVGAVAFAVAATVALGACGSSAGAKLPANAPASASGDQAAAAAPKAKTQKAAKVEKVATVEKVEKVEKVEQVEKAQEPVAPGKASTRSGGRAPQKSTSLRYVKIVEPFGSPGRCNQSGTTIEMTACVLKQVVDVDYTVDALQRERFEYTISTAGQKEALQDDANWLAKRTRICSQHATGGSIDQITAAQCLLKVSKARVNSLS